MVPWQHPYLLIFLPILACSRHVFSLQAVAHSHSSVQTSCPEHERSALLHFGRSFHLDCPAASSSPSAYPKVKSWTNSQDCCSWDGVKCDGKTGHVIGLDLSSSCLLGPFPSNSTLFSLVHLQELSLADNNFDASSIPSQLGQLTSLRRLNLSRSAFSGQVPSQLSKLSRLLLLDLSGNGDPSTITHLRLEDPSMEELVRNLTHLTRLHLDFVDISSPVPTILTNFTSLKLLSLKFCNLYGQFPTGIFGLPYLEYLDLGANNDLEGFLPEFQPNSPLTELILLGTSFHGEVPPSIGQLSHLEVLNLGDSAFSGSIPSALGNLTKLTTLSLGYNNFSGDIPSTLANLTQLQSLGLSDLSAVTPEKLHLLLSRLNKVTGLALTGMNLATEIPSFLANFTKLQTLDLADNQLTGQVPLWLMNLTQLETLLLERNHFKGPIPEEISQIVNLQWLVFSDNDDLYGNFEPFLKLNLLIDLKLDGVNLIFPGKAATNESEPKYSILSLSSCNLSEFPQFLRNQDMLQNLDLSNNRIRGSIPHWFVNITGESIYTLDLSNNSITGFEQPIKFLPWNNLEVLYLGSNQLQGSLLMPPGSMKIYDVSHNQLVGAVSQQICRASSLKFLDLSDNNLSGPIPGCLSALGSSLEVLNLRSNSFHGILPRSYTKSCKLKMINLSQNQLEGTIPRSLVNCNMLVVFDIGQNRVNDTFPSWLKSLPNLQILVLRHNNLHGRIVGRPKVRGDFQSLQVIDISHNFFTGDLPTHYLQIWDAMKITREGQSTTSGTQIVLDTNTLTGLVVTPLTYSYSITITNKGNDMLYQRILTVFRVVDFSSNNFTGEIPEFIGELRGLQALNLSHNNLVGRIPPSLSNMKDLESLDLSMNKLSGRIPQELTQLTFLEVFNVSHNLLVGPIPQGKQFDAFDNSSYDGNPGLCGTLLSNKCGNTPDSAGKTGSQEEEEEEDESDVIDWVIKGLGCLSGFIVGCVFGNYLTDRYHDWFVETFGRKKRRPRTRVQGARRQRG